MMTTKSVVGVAAKATDDGKRKTKLTSMGDEYES